MSTLTTNITFLAFHWSYRVKGTWFTFQVVASDLLKNCFITALHKSYFLILDISFRLDQLLDQRMSCTLDLFL